MDTIEFLNESTGLEWKTHPIAGELVASGNYDYMITSPAYGQKWQLQDRFLWDAESREFETLDDLIDKINEMESVGNDD